jgi:uncharacterized protein YukE
MPALAKYKELEQKKNEIEAQLAQLKSLRQKAVELHDGVTANQYRDQINPLEDQSIDLEEAVMNTEKCRNKCFPS